MRTRVAGICPQLDLEETAGHRAASYASAQETGGIIGNGILEVQLHHAKDRHDAGLFLNKVTGETLRLAYSPFEASFDVETVNGAEGKFGHFEAFGSADASLLRATGSFGWFDVEVAYVLRRGDHFLQKSITFRGLKQKALLHKVSLFQHRIWPEYKVVLHDAGMYYPIVFVRAQKGGLFFCVDFPGYFVRMEGKTFSFDCYPGETLEPGRSFQTLTSHIGVTALTGRTRSNPYHETGAHLDIGEQQWFRKHLLREARPLELPSLEVKGAGTHTLGASELELMDQCKALGARHVLMPRILNSLDAYPLMAAVKTRLAQEGLSAALVVSRVAASQNLRWVALAPDGSPAGPDFGPCFASDEYRDFLIDHNVGLMERHGLRNLEIEGTPIVECHSGGHAHRPARESIQRAFQGLVEVAAALKENFAHLRCASLYGSYGAGMTKLFDSIGLVADEHPLPLPDIHVGRMFADMGRLYFRRSHDFVLPKSKLSNSVGLAPESYPDAPYAGAESYPWYLYHDSIGWRYGLISAIATGLRHRFHALPQDLSDADREFARHWLAWEKENVIELMDLEEILDEPGLNHVDGYSSATSQGAFIFLFNCGYDPQDLCLRLRLSHDSEYLVRELYPREMNYLGPNEGFFRKDSEIHLTLNPKEARIVEVVRRTPAHTKRRRPQVFGAQCRKNESAVIVHGEPGARVRVGLRTLDAYRELDVQLPGVSCDSFIREWTYAERMIEEGLGTLSKGGFSGERFTPRSNISRNVWLCSRLTLPQELGELIETSPFKLLRPCWAYPNRLFFVIRFEPAANFDPVRTASDVPGIPEAYLRSLPIKCGIDLAPLNLGLRAWVNGAECPVHPSIAAWKGFSPSFCPIVAYFFEAGSRLKFGPEAGKDAGGPSPENDVVLFARNFDAHSFRGVYIEHLPSLTVTQAIAPGESGGL